MSANKRPYYGGGSGALNANLSSVIGRRIRVAELPEILRGNRAAREALVRALDERLGAEPARTRSDI